jgi:hypothetical protein
LVLVASRKRIRLPWLFDQQLRPQHPEPSLLGTFELGDRSRHRPPFLLLLLLQWSNHFP